MSAANAANEANKVKTVFLENVSAGYRDGRQVLQGLNFTLEQGERVALIGPTGAGKSTLFAVLTGLLPVEDGRAGVAGLRLVPASYREIRRKVGLVFQDPDDQLFMPTVLDDVTFGPLNRGATVAEAERLARDALQRLGVAHLADRFPHHLSYGERKRVAIAAVLCQDPEVWLLDEPTANLDPRHRRLLIDLLAGLQGTTVLATHDLNAAARLCQRVIILNEGRVVADGPAAQILGDEALLDRTGLR